MLAPARWITTSALVAAGAVSLAMAPEPDPVPRRWQFDVVMGPLRLATFTTDKDGPRTYAYCTYKVTNNSGDDLLFAPSFELSLGAGETIKSGRAVPAEVSKKLIERSQNPFLQDQISVIGNLMQGAENAKEGLVVFTMDNLKPEKIAVYAAGFSGETTSLSIPGAAEKVLLRKTLCLDYVVTGELTGRGDKPIDLSEQRWVMR
ncbi:MAG: hypothetical protein ACT4PL_01920 [Phycisphaerales bacterium]